jgi:hypothetical protein
LKVSYSYSSDDSLLGGVPISFVSLTFFTFSRLLSYSDSSDY